MLYLPDGDMVIMVKPDFAGKERILEFLECTKEDVEKAFEDASKVVDYINSRIGEKDLWQVSDTELCWLYTGVRLMRAPLVAETGVGPGSTSTGILDASAPFRGRLFSFDLGKKYGNEEEEMPVGFLVPDKFRDRWSLVLGDTNETLEGKLSYFGPFDVFFHDSNHTYEHVTMELETALRNLRKKFLIVVDNYDWTEAPVEFAEKHGLTLVKVADDMCFIFREEYA